MGKSGAMLFRPRNSTDELAREIDGATRPVRLVADRVFCNWDHEQTQIDGRLYQTINKQTVEEPRSRRVKRVARHCDIRSKEPR